MASKHASQVTWLGGLSNLPSGCRPPTLMQTHTWMQAPPPDTHPPPIQSTSGRYASYWNAHLLYLILFSQYTKPNLIHKLYCNQCQHVWSVQQECITVGRVPSAAVAVCQGVSAWGGCLPGGCVPGGVCLGGVFPRGCLHMECLARRMSAWGGSAPEVSALGCLLGVSAPREQNDRQTGVKTLPCRNFVADGKNTWYLLN